MKTSVGMGLALMICGVAEAADPPHSATAASNPPLASAPAAPSKAAAAKPLNLQVGDIRNYMMPNEFRRAINAPDADASAVVVEGTRNAPLLQSELPVPGGLASLWYAARHPSQSWRILLPDVNAPAMGPTYDKIPPPVFRWGP